MIGYLLKSDTASISALIDDEDNRNNKFDENLENAREFRKITSKYGVPGEKALQLTKGENGENIVSVPVMEQVDSSLNIRKATLYIAFYPDRFLSATKKILDYGWVTIPVEKQERKLIIAPSFSSPSNSKRAQ